MTTLTKARILLFTVVALFSLGVLLTYVRQNDTIVVNFGCIYRCNPFERQEVLRSVWPVMSTRFSAAQAPTFQLFVTFSPKELDGISQFRDIFMRSVQFFWPLLQTNLLIVADAEMPNRAHFVSTCTSLTRRLNSTRIVYGNRPPAPRWRKSAYNNTSGWFRQQWYMFWADNFTTTDYIGFVDSDTVMTTVPLPGDVFHGNRPVMYSRYGKPDKFGWWLQTARLLKQPTLHNCMDYFPVVIKREHLQNFRQHLIGLHDAMYFDEVFRQLSTRDFSQFMLLCNYLWHYHREDYWWKVEPDYNGWNTNSGWRDLQNVGITDRMILPAPRIADHYGHRGEEALSIDQLMRRGYCFFARGRGPVCEKIAKELTGLHTALFEFENRNLAWHAAMIFAYDERLELQRFLSYQHVWNKTELHTLGITSSH